MEISVHISRGKKEVNNNSYFCFTSGNFQLIAAKMPWYDERDNSKLNLVRWCSILCGQKKSEFFRNFISTAVKRQTIVECQTTVR